MNKSFCFPFSFSESRFIIEYICIPVYKLYLNACIAEVRTFATSSVDPKQSVFKDRKYILLCLAFYYYACAITLMLLSLYIRLLNVHLFFILLLFKCQMVKKFILRFVSLSDRSKKDRNSDFVDLYLFVSLLLLPVNVKKLSPCCLP